MNTAEQLIDTISFSDQQKNKKIISSFISIFVHIVVFGAVRFLNFSTSENLQVKEENYIDLGYQQFDEVPEVVSSNHPVVKTEEIIPEKNEEVSTKTEEMQDQSSDIQGLQKEVKERTVSSNNTTTVPYYKIKPKYPREALESNLEGHVMMQIDILEDGSVENIKVTGGEKTSVFESSATRAVSKWKYKSFTDEAGHAIKKEKYLVRVDFKIKNEVQTQ